MRRRRCRRRSPTSSPRARWPTGCSRACSCAIPNVDAHLLRGPDRLDPLHPRPGRSGVGAQPRLERLARPRARAAEHLLLGSHLRLLLRRRRRARGDRRHRPRPGDVRDRLPARRRHLAAQRRKWPRSCSPASTTTSCTRSCAATRCASSGSADSPQPESRHATRVAALQVDEVAALDETPLCRRCGRSGRGTSPPARS